MMQLLKKSTLFSGIISGVLMAAPAFAQSRGYLSQVTGTGLGEQELPAMIGTFISVLLSILGIVLLILIIWSGIQWMTAGGNTDAVGEAKQRLINAVIGLVLVMAALAISTFVFDALSNATGANPDQGVGG